MTERGVDVDRGLLEQAEAQTKLLKAIQLRADFLLLLVLIGVVLSLGGVFR